MIDRLWPRGVSKEDAKLDEWDKELAPSTELRKWFDHQEERFDEFVRCYREELKDKKEPLDKLREKTKHKTLCFLYAAKDHQINQAVVLRDVLVEGE